MIKSMIAHTTLLESLCSEALKTIVYPLNRVLNKTVAKISYDLWARKTLSIRHLYVRGCPAETRLYMPHEKKLDSRTISCFFVRYFRGVEALGFTVSPLRT